MTGFFVFALAFVGVLTVVVRLATFRVRRPIPFRAALGLTFSFLGLLFLAWWFVTRGQTVEDRILAPLILPSPLEVLKAFPPLHFDQGLVRSALTSFLRVTLGFSLATIVALPLGIYMATFPPVAAFFRPDRKSTRLNSG